MSCWVPHAYEVSDCLLLCVRRIKRWVNSITHMSLTTKTMMMQLTRKWCPFCVFSDDINIIGDTPYRFGAIYMALKWTMFVHYQVKFNRSYLLNKNTMVMGLSYIKEHCSQLFLRSKLNYQYLWWQWWDLASKKNYTYMYSSWWNSLILTTGGISSSKNANNGNNFMLASFWTDLGTRLV